MGETWRAVPGFEGLYEISDQGRVLSLARIDKLGNPVRQRIMSQHVTAKGYHRAQLSRDGVTQEFFVHRLVLMAFDREPGSDEVTRHLDGNPHNNQPANLAWGTHVENNRDRVRHGTHHLAAKTHCPAGHPYEGENLYVYPDGHGRKCRMCQQERQQANREILAKKARDAYQANPEKFRERARAFRSKQKQEIDA